MRGTPQADRGGEGLRGSTAEEPPTAAGRPAGEIARRALSILALLLPLVAAPAAAADTPVLAFTSLSDAPDPVLAGEQLTITVQITNSAVDPGAGQDNDSTGTILSADLTGLALGTAVSDTLPGVCTVASSILSCPIGTIADAGGVVSGTITLDVLAAAADGGTLALDWDLYSNEIASPGVDGVTSTTVDTEAALAVTALAPVATEAVPGQTLVYHVRVANAGPSDAASVSLTVSAVTGLAAPTVAGACATLPCDLTTIASGGQKDVDLTYTVPDDFHIAHAGIDPIVHTVTVTSSTPAPASPDDRAQSFSTPVVPKANLSVSLTDGVTNVVAGEAISYLVTVSSAGPSRVDAVTLSGLLPALSAVYAPSEGWFSASSADGNWDGIDLATTEAITMTVTGFISPATTSSPVAANVTVAPRSGITDPAAGNNSASDGDTVLSRVADLRITKTNNVDGVAPAQLVPYTIRVSNEGPSDVSGADVDDDFDGTRVTSVAWTCAPGRALTGTGQLLDGSGGVDGLDGATAVAASSDGKHVYVTGSADNGVAVFARTAATGALAFVEVKKDGFGGVDGLAGASAVAIAPGGQHVYVTGATDNAVAVFSRNSATGALTFVEVEKDGIGGVDGLAAARGVAVAPDGRHVYVTGETDDAVAVFARNATTGALTFVEVEKDGFGGVDGLDGARGVAVSPDGRTVVVAGATDDALVSFTRDLETGALTYADQEKDGVGLNGLDGATAVAFGPRGDTVYVAAATDSALVAFTIDGVTGALGVIDAEFDGVSGVDGLADARGVVVSPNGRYVYVTGASDGEIAVFTRVTTAGGTYGKLDYVEVAAYAGATAAAMTPGGEQVYAVSLAGSSLGRFDETAGAACVGAGTGDLASQLVDLPAHATVTFLADATISPAASGTLVNTAFVTAPAGVTTDATTPLPAGICLVAQGDTSNNRCTDADVVGLEADLSVTKTAGAPGAVPGESLTYVIIVANAGPAGVAGAAVTDADLNDPDFASATWTCTANGGALCGSLAGSGNISQAVTLPAGGSVRFDVTVQIAAGASGVACPSQPSADCVLNAASVVVPVGYVDPTPADLSAQTETPIGPRADLSITKTVLSSGVGAGDPLDYQITVRNCGPSDVTGAQVLDTFPPGYVLSGWTCSALNGSCPPSGASDIAAAVDLDAGDPGTCAGGGVATFLVSGSVDSLAQGVLTNVAKVTEPSGVFDPTPGNNTSAAKVVLSAVADLSIIKDDGLSVATPGGEVTYTITVANSGPDNAEEVAVSDVFPAILRDVHWTCSSESSATGELTFVEELRDGAVIGEDVLDGLAGAAGVVVSPDPDGAGPQAGGANVYAIGSDDDALVAFARDASTGKLTAIGLLVDGAAQGPLTIDGLDGAAGVAASADGRNVYVAGFEDDAIAVFSRNLALGTLTFVQVIRDGDGGTVDGLAGARSVVVSPDGEHVYVAGELDDAVAVFSRDASLSGSLGFEQVVRDGVGGFSGLSGARALALSDDGAHLYVAAGGDHAVTTLARERAELSPDFGHLSFVESLADGDVQGASTLDLLAGASGIGISPGGRHVYVTAATDAAVSIFSRNDDSGDLNFGRLTYQGARFEGDAGAGGASDGIDGASSATVSADGQHVYVTGANAVAVFQRSTATGALKFVQSRRDGVDAPCAPSGLACPVNSLAGSRAVALAPDDLHLYVAGSNDGAVSVFARAGAPPAFAFAGGAPLADPPLPVRDNQGGVDGLDAVSALAVTADGQFLYAAGFADKALAAFRRDPATGHLTFIEVERDGVGGVDGLEGASAILIVGSHVYVASQSTTQADNALATFERNPSTGELAFVGVLREGQGGVTGLFGAEGLASDPGGKHVYVASKFPGAVAVFSRDALSGVLTFVEAKKNGVGGVVGLQGAAGVAVSSDGEHVYVTASVDDAVAIFRRETDGLDPDFGRLTEIGLVQDEDSLTPIAGALLVPGLDRALGVVVSPDPGDGTSSRNVYVTGHTDNALVVFGRNVDDSSADFGQLTLLQDFADGADGVDGLAGARAVAISSDGKNVYVAGENDAALAVFAREEVGGTLVYVEARKDGVGGVDGLDQAYAVTVAPNGRHVYVAGFGEDAIAEFSRSSGSRCTGSGVGNIDDLIDVAANGQVVYTVVGRVDPGATGLLVNVAQVDVPAAIDDPGPGASGLHEPGVCPGNSAVGYPALPDNDACRDIDALAPKADLEVIKTDHDDVAIPGEELTYTITVVNDGPSNVVGATVYDDLSAIFPAGVSWSCVAAPSGTLTFLAAYAEGDAQPGPVTLAGLDGASGVAVSPDGLHLYATGLGADGVAVFSIDVSTGALTFLEAELDGVGGVDGLDGASAIAVSADGEHVYVAGQLDDAIVVFRRESDSGNPDFGKLTAEAVVQDAGNPAPIAGADLVSGLDQPVGLALDPAGESLYVAAANSSAVTVFSRNGNPLDPDFGKLTWVEAQIDGVGGVDGLAGASSVAVSPDGAQVYGTGANDDSIAVFSRAAGTGALTYLEKKSDGVGAVDGMATPRAVTLSSDGLSVYVAGAGDDAVAVFGRDAGSGTLTFVQAVREGVGGVTGLGGADGVAVSVDGFHVYAAGGSGNGVVVLRRSAESGGSLEFVETQRTGFGPVDGTAGASAVALTPNGELVFVAGRVDDAVAVFRRPIDSSCSGGSDTSGPAIELIDVANIAANSQVVYTLTGLVDPDICPSYPCTGVQLQNVATVSLPSGTSDPNAGDNSDTDVDALSPRVDLSITKTDGISVVQGLLGASAVALSPDGAHVYATGFLGDGVAAFVRDAGTGDLAYVASQRDGLAGVDGLNGASSVFVSPDGAHVYVGGASDNAVAVFARNAATGELAYVEKQQSGQAGVVSMLGPSALVGSNDGRFLYVAAASSSAIAVFAREDDPGSPDFGRLTFLGALSDGVGGVDGLALVRALALAPDGAHLYAVGEADSGVAVFARNAASGALTFRAALFDGVAGVSGIAGASDVAVAPDGKHVYVTGRTANGMAVFAREVDSGNPNYGKLTFAGALFDGAGGIDGLAGAASVLVAVDPPGADPGGQHVYVTGAADDGVAVFARDAGTGALAFVAVRRNGSGGVSGLGGASAAAASPDGRHVYVTGADDAAVVALARDWDSGTETGSGDLAFVGLQRDGDGTVAPGTEITYAITVVNHGPSAVRNAIVTDVFPGELEDVSWQCIVLTPGAACLGGLTGTGDLVKPVRLPPNGSVRIDATGTIKPGVTGTVSNTATVAAPVGVIELDPSDNSATDADTVLGRVADLEITKIACTDPLDCAATTTGSAVPGTTVFYQVRVENLGPSDVQGARVTDVLPEALVNGSWSCVAEPVAGLLSTIEVERDGDPLAAPLDQPCGQPDLTAVDGLDRVRALALSPDGLNVYAAGANDDAIAVFRRDLRNGRLDFVESVRDGAPIRNGACAVIGSIDGLDEVSGVVVSPDGQHVYATAEADDAIVAFERDPATGALRFLQFLRDGVGGANGLGNVLGLAISPDGAHLYTAAASDNGVGVFARNAATGLLTFVGIRVDGQVQGALTLDGLAGASAVLVSPDGTSVYVAGAADGGVAAFARNGATGQLTFVEAEKDGVGGVDGLAGASALTLSEDGRHLYATGTGDNAVALFRRTPATGALDFETRWADGLDGVDGLAAASALALSPDGEHLYVAGTGDDAVAIFFRDDLNGDLAFLGAALDGAGGIDGLAGVRALLASNDGDQVYAAGAAEDALAVLARHDGSRCTPQGYGDLVDTVDLVAGGSATYLVQGSLAPAATGTLVNSAAVAAPDDASDPDSANDAATLALDITPVVALALSKSDGQTEAIPGLPLTYTITIANAGPSDLVGAEIEDLFPAAFVNATWTCSASGAIAALDLERQGIAGVTGLVDPYAVVVAPDPDGAFGPETGGAHVYTAARGSNALAVFARDAGTGALAFVTSYADGVGGVDGLGGAGGLALSPDGRHLYATGATDGALAVFARNVVTGLLTPVQVQFESDPAVDGLAGAVAVTVSPDGRHVYVASAADDAVAVFARDVATGALTFVERQKDGFGGLELQVIDGASALAVTPDGEQLLVAGAESDTLALFDRNADSGRLTFRAVFRDGEAGVEALDLPEAVVISPSGRFVYVAALADDAIAQFERDPLTGDLAFVAEFRDGVGGLDGLDGVRGLAISADGLYLFATGYNEDALVAFRRNSFTGALEPLAVVRDGVGSFDGLDGARGVAVAPDGPGIYVVADQDDTVAALLRQGAASCFGAAGGGDLSGAVDLAVGGTVSFTVHGLVLSSATGQLVNTVSATMPAPTTNLGDTSATDIDDLTPVAGLSIVKDDFTATAIPGTSTIYLLTVANSGPSDAPDSLVADLLPAAIVDATWTCEAQGTASCAASGTGDLGEAVDLPAGSSVVFALVAAIDPAASGTLTNTATVAPAAGVQDPAAGDNTSSDVDTLEPHSDLAIEKSIDDSTPEAGGPVVFTLAVTVGGPSAGFGAQVIDLLPAGLTAVGASGTGWTCVVGSGVVTCDADATLPLGAAPPIQITANAPLAAGNYVNAATVSSTGIDGTPANDADTVSFAIGAPAHVVQVDSLPAAPGGELDEMETVLSLLTGATVEFSQVMADPAGDGDPADVTNPANYRVVEAGSDGVFSTVGCGALAGDDESAAIGPVTYAAGTATLAVGGGVPLRDGLYRLVVCDTVEDSLGQALDGDDDGLAGGDFVRHFRVRVDNLIQTPFFDFDADLANWTLIVPAVGDIFRDGAEDGDGFPLSGSAHATNPTAGTLLTMRQCLSGVAPGSYVLLADARIDAPVGSDVVVRGAVDLFPAAAGGCVGGIVSRSVALATTDTGGTWAPLVGLVPNLQSGGGAFVSVVFEVQTMSGSPLDVWLDSMNLTRVLFADGFESGSTSAWTLAAP